MKPIAPLILLVAAVGIAACAPAPAPAPAKKAPPPDTSAVDERAIRAAGELGFDALRKGDAASVAAFYSEDAVLMPANRPYVVGRRAIKDAFADEFMANKQAGVTLVMDEMDIGVSGMLAWRTGTFLGTGPDGKPQGSGKFLQVWEKQEDGLWQITHSMFNFDAPRAAPAPAH